MSESPWPTNSTKSLGVTCRLVRRRTAKYGTALYELTEAGGGTADVLYELARFGAAFPPDKVLHRPGNLRTIALPLRIGCQRAADPSTNVLAELIVDDERFALSVKNGIVDVRYGAADDSEVTLTTSYEPFVEAGDGRMPLDEFASKHMRVEGDPDKVRVLMDLLGRALVPRSQ